MESDTFRFYCSPCHRLSPFLIRPRWRSATFPPGKVLLSEIPILLSKADIHKLEYGGDAKIKCPCEERSDVANRIPLVMHSLWGHGEENGLPRQYEHWLAMTFSCLCQIPIYLLADYT